MQILVPILLGLTLGFNIHMRNFGVPEHAVSCSVCNVTAIASKSTVSFLPSQSYDPSAPILVDKEYEEKINRYQIDNIQFVGFNGGKFHVLSDARYLEFNIQGELLQDYGLNFKFIDFTIRDGLYLLSEEEILVLNSQNTFKIQLDSKASKIQGVKQIAAHVIFYLNRNLSL